MHPKGASSIFIAFYFVLYSLIRTSDFVEGTCVRK
jgi:hypothetical protein